MTEQRALEKMRELEKYSSDPEYVHREADEILCDILIDLGYLDVVEAWERLPKWYA